MTQTEKRIFLIRELLAEQPQYRNMPIPKNAQNQKQLLRSLFNIRMPRTASVEFLRIQDSYLQDETAAKGINDITELKPIEKNIYLWKGDITTLKCGAIVNAANAQMLGCFSPCHGCIDNAIHTFAGVQLRQECAELMRKQGHEEPTGQAKITSAYNLPCAYVIHTVGPIVDDRLTEKHCKLLQSCYQSCLELAVKHQIESIAFCCISTGVFHFPGNKAADIAVQTVKAFQKNNEIKVIFNVFEQKDYDIYRKLLG